MTETTEKVADGAGDGWDWAIVEVFGHRKHAGRIREEERFGAKMLRIDVPTVERDTAADQGSPALKVTGWATRYYGGGSLFSLTLTDEATVLNANRGYEPPARLSYTQSDDFEQDDDGSEE